MLLTLQYAVDSINRLVEQGQGLTEGLHILITISVILLSKEIISALVQFGQKFYGEKPAFWYHKTWHKVYRKIFNYRLAFLMPIKTKQVSVQTRIDRGIGSPPVWYKSFYRYFATFLAVPLWHWADVLCQFYVGLVATSIIPFTFG